VAIHSFTPCLAYCGCARPWPVGILWNQDGRLALPLIESLKGRGILCGDNEPYSGRLANHTVDRHGQDAGRRHVSIEIRQDEIADEAGVLRWATLLAEVLEGVLAQG
jgi:predicted N-formylglutamate amidohydrolase